MYLPIPGQELSHPSKYYPSPVLLNFSDQMGTGHDVIEANDLPKNITSLKTLNKAINVL